MLFGFMNHHDGANPGLSVVKPTQEMHIYIHVHNLAVCFPTVQNWRGLAMLNKRILNVSYCTCQLYHQSFERKLEFASTRLLAISLPILLQFYDDSIANDLLVAQVQK